MSILGIVVLVIVACLLFWAINYLAAAFGLPPQVKAVLIVILVIVVVLYLVQALGGGGLNLRL